jgi:hypothetical protein
MNEDERREIAQLWAVAEMYYTLATDAKSHLVPTELKMTVGEFAERCKNRSYLDEHTPLLFTVAHLASCAVRLHSIEEKLNSKRWQEYWKIATSKDQERIKQELKNNIDSFIHFLMRHGVAHSESERKNSRYKKAFKVMYDFYLTLSYESVLQAMAAARQSIKNELEARGDLAKA